MATDVFTVHLLSVQRLHIGGLQMNAQKSEEPDSIKEQQQLPLPFLDETKDRIEANLRRAVLKAEREKNNKASAG